MDVEEFKRDRLEAFLSLDEAKIRAYMVKYGISYPTDLTHLFWAGVHKARTALDDMPEEEKQISRDWLISRGLKPLG